MKTMALLAAAAVLTVSAPQSRAQTARPDWIADARTGCKVWNGNPQANETVNWGGPCERGLAQGSGELRWFKDGEPSGQYVGEFRDGKQHGQGSVIWANGDTYVGEFRDGKPVGEFRAGKRIGQGTQTSAPPPNYQLSSPNYQPPATKPLVAAIQAMLSALGFNPGAADGVTGPQTARAISEFQLAVGGTPDGLPSEALRVKLVRAVAERGVSPSPRAPESKKPPTEVVSSGTGFFIQRDVLVTNHHVIDGCTEVRIRISGADIGRVRVIAVSKVDDLAALKWDSVSDAYLQLRVDPPLKPAEAVVVFGYPLSGALFSTGTPSTGNTTLGNVTALTGLRDDSRYIQISAAIHPGNSGGPMLDGAGRLIGVVVGKINDLTLLKATGQLPQNVNFAIRSSILSNFLEAHQIFYEVAAKAEAQPSTKVAEHALAASVQIRCLK